VDFPPYSLFLNAFTLHAVNRPIVRVADLLLFNEDPDLYSAFSSMFGSGSRSWGLFFSSLNSYGNFFDAFIFRQFYGNKLIPITLRHKYVLPTKKDLKEHCGNTKTDSHAMFTTCQGVRTGGLLLSQRHVCSVLARKIYFLIS
jgi:hypothetical protein